MCAKIAYLILAALFTFIVATVASFVYLEWWQALLVSLTTFVLIIVLGKFLVRRTLGNLKNLAKGMFDAKSRVLRNATADIHTVKPTEMPQVVRNLLAEAREGNGEEFEGAEVDDADLAMKDHAWFQIEATIFPDASQAKEMQHWDLDDLRLIPFDTPKSDFTDDDREDGDEFDLHDVALIRDEDAIKSEESKFHGPQRLRFAVGVPRDVRELKFQYYFEQFGHIKLPSTISLPRRKPR